MLRLLILVAVILLVVYVLRRLFQVNVRTRFIRRPPEEPGGRVIEGEPPQVRDAQQPRERERDPRP